MDGANQLVSRYGEFVNLGVCLVGRNLNLCVLRGHARLDTLALVSAPDVYDQVDNPTGTQRALDANHAQAAFEYALESVGLPPEDEPRAFPEVILNARDKSVLEVYDLEDEGNVYDVDSYSDPDSVPSATVGVRILAQNLEWPKPTASPQISRVDGNHRLYEADIDLSSEDELLESGNDYPVVPFTLLVGLEVLQEATLFRDVNSKHMGMETAHLDTLTIRTHDPIHLKTDPGLRPLWVAHRLTEPGRAFEGTVFFGGSKAGLKRSDGQLPPIKINSLKTTIAGQLKAAPVVEKSLSDKPEQLLELLDRYWKAVRETFPEAWQNRRDYVLMQAIGLGAFAKLGGVILDRAWDDGAVTQEDMAMQLKPVAAGVTLERTSYKGIAGAGGVRVLADLLIEAADADSVKKERNIEALTADHPVDPLAPDSQVGSVTPDPSVDA